MGVEPGSIERLIYETCLRLDLEDFAGYLDLCAAEFTYRITTYSAEIRKDMIWLHHDREGMQALFENYYDHVRRLGSLHRHVAVYAIDRQDDGLFRVTSSFQVTHTDLEGQSKMFAVGRYHDVVGESENGARLHAREARLETRELGSGSHLPI